jgi:hypothetical protein
VFDEVVREHRNRNFRALAAIERQPNDGGIGRGFAGKLGRAVEDAFAVASETRSVIAELGIVLLQPDDVAVRIGFEPSSVVTMNSSWPVPVTSICGRPGGKKPVVALRISLCPASPSQATTR